MHATIFANVETLIFARRIVYSFLANFNDEYTIYFPPFPGFTRLYFGFDMGPNNKKLQNTQVLCVSFSAVGLSSPSSHCYGVQEFILAKVRKNLPFWGGEQHLHPFTGQGSCK